MEIRRDIRYNTYFCAFFLAHFCLAKMVFFSHVSEFWASACACGSRVLIGIYVLQSPCQPNDSTLPHPPG